MAQTSRNERRKRRQRRNISLLSRELRTVNARHINAQFTLLAILQAAKGAFVVGKDEATAVLTGFAHLNWKTERQEDGSMRVELVDSRTVATDAPETSELTENTDATETAVPRSVTAQLAHAE